MTSSLWMREAYRAPATLQLQQLSSTTSVVCFLFAGIKQDVKALHMEEIISSNRTSGMHSK